MRNKLLNVQTTSRGGALELSEPGLDAVWHEAAELNHTLTFQHPTRADYQADRDAHDQYVAKLRSGELDPWERRIPDPIPFLLKDKCVIADMKGEEMLRRCKAIRQRARTLREERGVDALYLAFGTVRWRESNGREHAAPLVLLPVELSARSRGTVYSLKATGEPPVGNITFGLYLERNFQMALPALPNLRTASDLDAYFESVRKAVEGKRWTVERTVVLSVFSFATINMYYDLRAHHQKIAAHPVVRALCGDTARLLAIEAKLPAMAEVERRATELNPGDAFQVIDADYSQARAIEMANAGYSFVLQGPPGTGKSQTITNIIAESLGRGKKVLFVSEKRAALDVVYRRLEDAGLASFTYVLHDVKQNKKDAIKELAKQLDADPPADVALNKSLVWRYNHDKRALDTYAEDMVRPIEPLNASPWEVCNELVRLRDAPRLSFTVPDLGSLSEERLEDIRYAVRALADAEDDLFCEPALHPWRGLKPVRPTDDLAHGLAGAARGYLEAIRRANRALQGLQASSGIALPRKLDALAGVCGAARMIDGSAQQQRLLSIAQPKQAASCARRLQEAGARYEDVFAELVAACGHAGVEPPRFTHAGLRELAARIDAQIARDPLLARWSTLTQEELESAVEGLAEELALAAALRDEILEDFKDEVFALDSRDALILLERDFSNAFKRAFSGRYKELCRQVERCQRELSRERMGYDELCELFRRLDAVHDATARLEREGARWQDVFPGLFDGARTDIAAVRERFRGYTGLCEARVRAHHLLDAIEKLEPACEQMAWAFELERCALDEDFGHMLDALEAAGTIGDAAAAAGCSASDLLALGSAEHRTAMDELRASLAATYGARERFAAYFSSPLPFDALDLDAAAVRLESALEHEDEIKPAARYAQKRDACLKLDLVQFVEAAEQARLRSDELLPAFERRVYTLWFEEAASRRPSIAGFSTDEQERAIEGYAKSDTYLTGASEQQVTRVLYRRIDAMRDTADARTLRREAGKRTHVMPIRKALATMPELVGRLKPCMMMSPLSVSTFLESDAISFDVVIFDEASQVCTANAIGAIARGRQVIIAGDSKQLPPTSFFTVSNGPDDDDDEDEEEQAVLESGSFESVLTEANALRSVSLRWHYRSRNESLISFSNREFYDGELVSFPSSREQRKNEGVSFEYVPDGVWKGARLGNPVEARRVAELVLKHFEEMPGRSLGVIAFGTKQADLIERELGRLREKWGGFERFFDEDAPEHFFIKSLENVQGDERDSIIISVGYGRDGRGRIVKNFGPINRAGGERRLNVAVTRAKHDLVLVSSMLDTDLEGETAGRGPALLREYIAYARACTAALSASARPTDEYPESWLSATEEQPDCPWLAAYIETELEGRGYAITQGIGASSCRIDLGVKLCRTDTDYVAGIIFDGPGYASAAFTRGRERIRPNMLQAMGWNLYRVWAQEWKDDPAGALGDLLAYLKRFGQPHDAAPAPTGAPKESAAAAPLASARGAEAEAGTRVSGKDTTKAQVQPNSGDRKPRSEAGLAEKPARDPSAVAPGPAGRRAAHLAPAVEPAGTDPGRGGTDALNSGAAAPAREQARSSSGTSSAAVSAGRARQAAPAAGPKPDAPVGEFGGGQGKALRERLKSWGYGELKHDENGFIPYFEVADPGRLYKPGDVDDYICAVLRAEAPINMNVINERVRRCRGAARVNAAVREDTQHVLYGPRGSEFELRNNFIYAKGKPLYPRHGGPREFKNICDEEVEEGMMLVLARLAQKGPVNLVRLKEKTHEAFGFTRLDGAADMKLNSCATALETQGRITLDGSQVILP